MLNIGVKRVSRAYMSYIYSVCFHYLDGAKVTKINDMKG